MSAKVVLVNVDMTDLYSRFPIKTLQKIAPQVPLGLCYLAAVLEENDIETVIIDDFLHEYPRNELVSKILNHEPDFVGFFTTTLNVNNSYEVAGMVKKQDPRIKTVFGGPHATMLPANVMQNKDVDYVVIGEGEYTLLDLVKNGNNGSNSAGDIKGLLYKDHKGDIKLSGDRELIPELDVLPFPARHLLGDLRVYDQEALLPGDNLVATIASSRGCPFRCTFCSSSEYWDRKFRGRTPENTVDEIEHLIDKYGARGIYFREDIFTLDKERVIGIAKELIRRKVDIEWECESRVHLPREMVELMQQSGCRAMWFGLETGSPKVLKIIKKGTTLEMARKVVKLCKELGIATGASFVIGFPGETREDVMETLEFAKELEPDYASFQSYLGLPVSPLYNQVLAEKLYIHREGDIYIIQTKELRYEELLELETYMNEEFIKHRVSSQVFKHNPFFSRMVSKMPAPVVQGALKSYQLLPASLRNRVKPLLTRNKTFTPFFEAKGGL